MPDKKLTDSEIVKALEICQKPHDNDTCNNCKYKRNFGCRDALCNDILDLINHLQAQVKKCEKVEHFADKTIATLQAENKRLKAPTTDWLVRGISPEQLEQEKIQAFTEEINRLQAENERLQDAIDEQDIEIAQLYKRLDKAKTESYKECIERVEEIICDNTYPDFDVNHKAVNIWKAEAYKDINNLLKELVGEDDVTKN